MAPIYADVIARLDERSTRAAIEQLERQFADASGHVGLSSADAMGRSFTSGMSGHGRNAAGSFMAGLTQGITSEMGGATSALSGVTTAFKGIGTSGAAAGVAASAGIAVIAVAAVKVGEALYGVGERFDAMADTLAVRTGKMGADLDALSASVRNVANHTASSLEQITDIGGRVSQSLSLTGSPLEDLTKQIADLNRMTGEALDIRQFGMTLRGFGEDGVKAGADLDALTVASQRTEIPLNELISTMGTLGPAARSLGLDFDDTAGLVTSFEKAGIDAGKTSAGLNKAVNEFADHNINLKTGLEDTITQLRGFIDAGNDAAAVDLAGKVFGTRSAQAFVDAVRQGTLSVKSLHDGLGATGGTVANLNKQTADWSEQWQIVKNRVDDLAGEIGGPLFDAINKALGGLNDLLEKIPDPRSLAGLVPIVGPNLAMAMGMAGDPATQPLQFPGGLGGGANAQRDRRGVPRADGTMAGQDIAGALADSAKGGSAGAPQIAYPDGYGQPPMPGETVDQWHARMANIAAQHDLEEKRARVTQLEGDQNATASEVIAAHNAVIDAGMRAWETEQAWRKAQLEQQRYDTKVSVPYDSNYGGMPRPGQTAAQYNAESSFYEAQHARAQAQAERDALQGSGTATAAQLQDANNKLVKARNDEIQAMLRLNEASKETSKTLDGIGTQLDADFGLSKGLPGVVENITKALAGMAMAPAMGQLSAIKGAGGAGSGLAGMLGSALGLGPHPEAAGAYPFGEPGYAQAPGWMPTPTISRVPVGGAATANYPLGAAGYSGDAALLAQVPRGGHYDAAGDLSQGLADCTSGIEDLVNMIDGQSTAGRSLHTNGDGTTEQWMASHGFLPTGAPVPGAFNIGYNTHHMEGTLPGGTNVNYGSNAAVASGGTAGAAGAWGDPSFTSHYYRPAGGTSPVAASVGITPTALPSYAPMTPSQLVDPSLSVPTPMGGPIGGIGTGVLGRGGLPQALPGAAMPGGPAAPSQSVSGGRQYGQGLPASSGISFGGGLIGSALSGAIGAAGGASSGFGGMAASAAADMGMQLLGRAAGAAGQYAGNIMSGLLETFSLNDSALADPGSSWLGRLGIAAAGMRPALPNSAGTMGGKDNPNMAEGGKKQPPGPLTPEQAAAAKNGQPGADGTNGDPGAGSGNGDTFNLSVTNNQRATADPSRADIQNLMSAAQAARQPR
jgi:DNA uptake protein ComE-like DNA-binding protein